MQVCCFCFFFSSRRRHTRFDCDWSSDVCSSDLGLRGMQMKAGACDIMLGQDDFAKGRERKKGAGFRLWVSTAQDISELAGGVKAKGWTLDREPSETPWGDWAFAVTDPDGFKITFIQE